MEELIILAGGLGTRLRPVVSDLPKCMAPVAGRPFIDHVLDFFIGTGIRRFILAVGYKSESIITHISRKYANLDIVYSQEEEPLGTGGAMRKACTLASSPLVGVANGDTLYKVDAKPFLPFVADQEPDCTLFLKPMTSFDRYGSVSIDENQRVIAFKEKQYYDEGLINGGFYLLNVASFLAEPFGEVFSFEKDYLEALVSQRKMLGLISDAYFIDIGIPADFERAQSELAIDLKP